MSDVDGLTPQELALLQPSRSEKQDAAAGVDAAHGAAWPDPVCLRRQLEVLESFHQDVSNRFADALSRSLQRMVEVRLLQVESLSYSQFVASRDDPTAFVVLEANPLPTSLVLDIAPPLLYPLLDCMLGGGQQTCEIPQRPATELEQRLVRGIVRTLLDELHEAWEPLLAIDLSIERIECHPKRVRVVAPADPVAILVFQVIVADQTGQMTLCLPSRSIRKMIDKLLVNEYPGSDEAARETDPRAERDAKSEQAASNGAATGDRPVVVQFTAETITAAERRNLRVGDVILSELTVDAPVDVVVDDHVVAQALLGAVDGQRAVEILD